MVVSWIIHLKAEYSQEQVTATGSDILFPGDASMNLLLQGKINWDKRNTITEEPKHLAVDDEMLVAQETQKEHLGKNSQLKLFHWNAHWQCFVTDPKCGVKAIAKIATAIAKEKIDFTSLLLGCVDANCNGKGQHTNGAVPNTDGYSYIQGQTKDSDWAGIWYNSKEWVWDKNVKGNPAAGEAFSVYENEDRAGLVAAFMPVSGTDAENFLKARGKEKIIVASVHMPHPTSSVLFDNALPQNLLDAGYDQKTHELVIMSDTNSPASFADCAFLKKLNDLFKGLNADVQIPNKDCPTTATYSLPNDKTCCSNSNFPYPFDRIYSSLDADTGVTGEFSVDPFGFITGDSFEGYSKAWEFHKPVTKTYEIQ